MIIEFLSLFSRSRDIRSDKVGKESRLSTVLLMGNTSSSGRTPPKITNQDKAILQLKMQRDKLQKTSKKIEVVIKRERQIAMESVKSGNKRRALLALKKKKYQENLMDTVERQTESLESLISTIEFKLIEKDVVYGLQQGNEVLKQLNNELSVDKVDKIMDDTQDGIEYQEELSDRLGDLMPRALDAEVDEELAEMEREQSKQPKETDTTKKLEGLPEAPHEEPKKAQNVQAPEPLPA